MSSPLFTLPIAPCDPHPGGTIVCTLAPSSPDHGGPVYILTLTSPPDNRLTTPVCQTMMRALDIIEFAYPPGVLVTTSGIHKFYSNGLDLDHAQEVEGYWSRSLYAMWKRFLTYPMPTIALINGHAFAGGLMTAFHHDYRIFNPSRGFLCLNELEFGAPLKAPMAGIFRVKALAPAVYRSLVLEAKRFNGPAALEGGLVDVLGGMDEVLKLVAEKKLGEKGKTGVYGVLKGEMYRECVGYLEGFEESEARDRGIVEEDDKRRERDGGWARDWVEKNGKGKGKESKL